MWLREGSILTPLDRRWWMRDERERERERDSKREGLSRKGGAHNTNRLTYKQTNTSLFTPHWMCLIHPLFEQHISASSGWREDREQRERDMTKPCLVTRALTSPFSLALWIVWAATFNSAFFLDWCVHKQSTHTTTNSVPHLLPFLSSLFSLDNGICKIIWYV